MDLRCEARRGAVWREGRGGGGEHRVGVYVGICGARELVLGEFSLDGRGFAAGQDWWLRDLADV